MSTLQFRTRIAIVALGLCVTVGKDHGVDSSACQEEIPGSARLCQYRSYNQIIQTLKAYAKKYPWAYYGTVGQSVEGEHTFV